MACIPPQYRAVQLLHVMHYLYLSSDAEDDKPSFWLVGFERPLIHYIPDLPDSIQFNEIKQPISFDSHFIAEKSSNRPDCIIFEYASLLKSDFRLLHELNQSPWVRQIPIIVLADKEEIDTDILFHLNIDDCYRRPVYWAQLVSRVAFLLENKAKIIESGNAVEPFGHWQRVKISSSKRLFDIVFASAALLALSPLMISVAILIWLESPGKIIYRSRRVGKNFDEFDFFKFRSMYQDADQRLKDMMAQNQYGENAVFVKFVNDPRITRVGRFIRKYSIDELPQLLNVLRGEMSLVGNRPLPVYEAEQLTTEKYSERFFAAAGLTGLWQVTKRGTNDMSTAERIALDVEYATCNSLLFDAKLLVRTATAFVQKENV